MQGNPQLVDIDSDSRTADIYRSVAN